MKHIEGRAGMNRRLRVQAMISTLTWGGAELLLSDFAVGARDAGIDLGVTYLQEVDGSPAAARLRALGIEPALVPITGLLDPRDHLRVRRHVARTRPDVLHTHLGNADFFGGIAARTLRIPSVSTIHVMEWESSAQANAKARIMDLARRYCADTVITVSESARTALVRAGLGRSRRLVTVHNGVDARSQPGSGRRVREELGIRADDLVVTMLSVLREGKGHETAMRSIRELRLRHPRLRLLIAGDGPARDRIHAAAAALGDGVVLAGHRDDVMAVLDATDILLHPSRVDAFPTALLQALAASVPIVATDAGGIPEIVEHGTSGLLVPAPPSEVALVQALSAMLDDDSVRRRCAAAGRRRFEAEFTVERWASRTRQIYEEALSRRGVRHHGASVA
jgi:glycosyltransferase involved in cell wall biosynthesis